MTPIEAIQGYLGNLNESLAECAEAVQAQADAQEGLQRHMNEVREMVGNLSDEVGALSSLLRQYITDTNHLRSEVREKLKAARG